MSPATRTKQQKKEFLNGHFLYEITNIQQIVYYHRYLATNFQLTQFHTNILIDAFLTHARNLLEFFYYDKDDKDYARAQHFMSCSRNWNELRPAKTTWIKKLEKRANLELSHLTYKRISGKRPEKNWDLATICKDLIDVTKVFLANINDDYVDEPIKRYKASLNT